MCGTLSLTSCIFRLSKWIDKVKWSIASLRQKYRAHASFNLNLARIELSKQDEFTKFLKVDIQ